MGDHKREYCKSGRHKMEGRNVVNRANGFRCCRACQLERNNRYKREQRKPRMHWGKFRMLELAVIHRALGKSGTVGLDPDLYQIHQALFNELLAHIDERNSLIEYRRLANQKRALNPGRNRGKIGNMSDFKSVDRNQLQKAFAVAHRSASNMNINLEGRKRLRLIARLIWDACGDDGPYRNRLDGEVESALHTLEQEAVR